MNSTRTPPPLPTSLEVEGPVPLALQGLPLLPLLMAQREFPGLHRLEFKLSEPLKKVIADGRLATEKAANSLSVNMLEYHQYGKKYLKKMNLSPDAILQLSLQVGCGEGGVVFAL